MKKFKIIVGLFCLTQILPACVEQKSAAGGRDKNKQASGTVQFPGNEEGARQLLLQFLQPGMDKQALTQQLRPTSEDFRAVFLPEVAKQAEDGYRQPWEEGKILIHGQPGQTELLLWSATVEELNKQSGDAGAFPSGYSKAASYFKSGLRFYRFKFVRPGEQLGFAWDGLIYVNGHWVIFPKPWRVIPGIVITVPAPEDQ